MADTPDVSGANAADAGDEDKPTTTPSSSPFVSVGGVTGRRAPIGVSETYRAKYDKQRLSQSNQMAAYQESGNFQQIAPQYFEDDLSGFANLSPEVMTQVQYALKNSGLLKSFFKARWGEDEENAMAKVLAYANRRGLLWEDALGEFASMAEEIGGTGPTGPTFTARLSNPDDLKKAFTQSLYDAQGGRFIDDTQMQQMIDAYQQVEYGAQRAAFDNAGTVVEPPSATTFAAEEAKKADPAGVQAAKYSDYAQVFEDVING